MGGYSKNDKFPFPEIEPVKPNPHPELPQPKPDPLPPPKPSGPTPWLTLARKYIGQREIEGGKDNPFIVGCHKFTSLKADDDETPWCASFVCRMLRESGMKDTNSAAAASYKEYGEHCDLKPGAVVVFKWAAGNRHVTFVDHIVDSDYVACLGGNQDNSVKVSNYARKWIEAIRFPTPVKR